MSAASLLLGSGSAWADGNNDVSLSPPSASAGSPGSSPTLSVSNMTPAPGATVDVGLGVSTCAPGSSVTPWMVLVQNGTTPLAVSGAPAVVADHSGGFAPVPLTVPAGDAAGSYVMFVTCASANGAAVATHSLTVAPAGQVTPTTPPDATWQAPATWANKQTRNAVNAAVDEAAAAIQPNSNVAPAPASNAAPRSPLSGVPIRDTVAPGEIAALTALLIGLSSAALWLRHRRRMSVA
ncbi:MAG: hypothetical protein ACRDV4_12565 [Acidimicrobiales bacterium]